jgi:Flp pilus assembly protein TadG
MAPHDSDRGIAVPAVRESQRGGIALLTAVALLLLLGICALAVNAGYKAVARQDLQGGVDAAAMAGAGALDGKSSGLFRAPVRAMSVARRNKIWTQRLGLNSGDAVPGYWDPGLGAFSTVGDTIHIGRASVVLSSDQPQYFNAVRVQAAADGEGRHPLVQTVFWTPTGSTWLDVHGSAVGVGGGACSDHSGCTLPIVLPSCAMTDDAGNSVCGTSQTIYFDHGNGKDAALANVVDPSGNVNNSTVRTQMAGGAACANSAVEAGQDVPLGNGDDFNGPVERALREPNNVVCSGAPPYDGCPHEQLPVAYINDCARPMVQSASVVGFARVVVLGTNPGGRTASITIYLDCSSRSTADAAGCAHFGYGGKPHLAQ